MLDQMIFLTIPQRIRTVMLIHIAEYKNLGVLMKLTLSVISNAPITFHNSSNINTTGLQANAPVRSSLAMLAIILVTPHPGHITPRVSTKKHCGRISVNSSKQPYSAHIIKNQR